MQESKQRLAQTQTFSRVGGRITKKGTLSVQDFKDVVKKKESKPKKLDKLTYAIDEAKRMP
jgi:hypothetical protein